MTNEVTNPVVGKNVFSTAHSVTVPIPELWDGGVSERQVVTITGGTGSYGQAMTEYLLGLPGGPKVRIVSRDEDKQEQMARRFPSGPRMTYILGDVRNLFTLERAFDGVDAVLHAAALKRVGFGERYPDEFLQTNTLGSWNVVRAAIACGVPRTLLISTDKACAAFSAYGRSKALAESLFIQGNSLGGGRGCRFSMVRGGNIWNSRGSVAHVWRDAMAQGKRLVVNGAAVTRFHLTMSGWLQFTYRALREMHGGETFIPRARAWSLFNLAGAFAPGGFDVCAPRDGDKAHEWLYSPEESTRTVDAGWAFVIEPPADFRAIWNYLPWACPRVPAGAAYSSEGAAQLSAAELAELAHG